MIIAKDKVSVLEFLQRASLAVTELTKEQIDAEAERILLIHVTRMERDESYDQEVN